MISASVVLYNTSVDLLDRVIRSYAPSEERRLYLIDNSPEPLPEACRKGWAEGIDYCFQGKNQGYGKAHNIGIEKAILENSRYHLVLNPDVLFATDVPNKMVDYADRHQDVVAMMPKVIYPDGEIQYLCKLLPTPFDLIFRRFLGNTVLTRKINDRYTLREFGYDRIINPPCLSGCFMFLRTKTLQEKQLRFDERFFMYCEDFDLIRRLHREGKTIFFPEVTIVHNHARESYKSKKMLRIHMRSAICYFNKYGWFSDSERTRMNRKILDEIRGNEKAMESYD